MWSSRFFGAQTKGYDEKKLLDFFFFFFKNRFQSMALGESIRN